MRKQNTIQADGLALKSLLMIFRCPAQILLCLFLLSGCFQTGPESTQTSSVEFDSLEDKVRFLNEYRSFARTFEQLDFDINYKNNNGIIPAPSDWDIRLIARIPGNEHGLWITDEMEPATPGEWITSVVTVIETTGLDQWYRKGGTVVGIDRKNSVIAYRHNTFGD